MRLLLELNQVVRRLVVEYPGAEGEPALDRQGVARAIGYFAGMPWNPDAFAEMKEALRLTYARRGYPAATVEGEVQPLAGTSRASSSGCPFAKESPSASRQFRLRDTVGFARGIDVRRELGLNPGDVYDQVALEEGVQRLEDLYGVEGTTRPGSTWPRSAPRLHQAMCPSERRLWWFR